MDVVDFGDQCGYMNKKGRIKIRPKASRCRGFSQGLAAVEIDGEWGFINKKGKMIIKPQFDSPADHFNSVEMRFSKSGLAPVSINSKGGIGYINRKGKIRKWSYASDQLTDL